MHQKLDRDDVMLALVLCVDVLCDDREIIFMCSDHHNQEILFSKSHVERNSVYCVSVEMEWAMGGTS